MFQRALATLLVSFLALVATTALAQVVVYSQPPAASGGLVKSSWIPPDGLDGDAYAYDDFTLGAGAAITEIRWRGGYTYLHTPVTDFSISIYPAIAGGGQPNLNAAALANWTVTGTAGETAAGTFGGVAMYDYQYTLPSPFQAVAGTQYWLQIEASSAGYPDWAWSLGTGGDSWLILVTTGAPTIAGLHLDVAFTLMTAGTPTSTIAASASPVGAGTIVGAGPYPNGTTAMLTATANAGYGFSNWTEGVTTVSGSPTYAFTVTADRTLVANFVTAYTITTAPSALYAGSASGGGTFNTGTPVTLLATPSPGFVFVSWSEAGTPLSTTPNWTFTPARNMALTAVFAPDAHTAIFDFDTGTPALAATLSGTPMAQTSQGQTAHFGGSAYWSVQSDQTAHFNMPLFSGNWLYPSSSSMTLDIRFDHSLSHISLNFSTADFTQMELASPLTITAYLDPAATPVDSATARALYIGGTMPAGTLALAPTTPFNHVVLYMPSCALCSSNFMVDNIVVTMTADTNTTAVAGTGVGGLMLSAPWPNPGAGAVMLAFALPADGRARLEVLDVAGRHVASLERDFAAGPHEWQWSGLGSDGARARAGLYFVRLTTPWGIRTRRLTRTQ